MTNEVREITEESVWENFVLSAKPHSFLQSFNWGKVYEAENEKVFRLGVFEGETIVAVAQLIKISARRGNFLLCPHGPLVKEGTEVEKMISMITDKAIEIGNNENCSFLRFCPTLEDTQENNALFKKLGFWPAPIHVHPELAWILDLGPSEVELLQNMRKTTRYLIRKSEKDGIIITLSSNPEDMQKFWPVYEATAKRQGFVSFGREYLTKEFEIFSKDGNALFFFGEFQGEIISVALIIFYAGSGFYHHSGSYQRDKVNASYLLQWHVILEAKKRGCRYYNFWGVSPEDQPKHPWAGLSLFKRGFSGSEEAYLHAQDKPLNKKYLLNYYIEKYRARKRGYR